ncbi:hypothetical protein HYR99_22935, partial [Candidatus Poribacteria bacterium]|nr:hypothetical protein [Candidatus Poribacteria bacterium]
QCSATIYPDGRQVDCTYDALDRLISRRDNGQGSNIGTYQYIGSWRAATLTYQNQTRLTHLGGGGGTTDVGFDALRRIVNHRWEVTSTSQLIAGFENQDGFGNSLYDRANNKRMEFKTHDPDQSEQYKYDNVYRLTSTGSGNQAANTRGFERGTFANASRTTMSAVNFFQDWDLEGVGNWSDFFNNSATAENRTHSDFNEIVQKGTATLTHDKNGNLTDDSVNTYEWDALNRLRKATRQSDSQLIGTYTYDCHNRRMRKVTATDTTYSYYDGWRVVEERDGGDAVTQQYVYGNYLDEVWTLDNRRGGITVAQLNDGAGNQRHFYHCNTLYHVYGLTDETGALKEGYQYDAYGRHTLVEPGGNSVFDTPDWGAVDDVFTVGKPSLLNNPYTYTGQRLDSETGLMYYKNRYYSQNLGRFISRWVEINKDLNLYEYQFSYPTFLTDPYGDPVEDANFHPYDHSHKREGPHFQWEEKGKQVRYDAKTLEPIGDSPPLSENQKRKLKDSDAWKRWEKYETEAAKRAEQAKKAKATKEAAEKAAKEKLAKEAAEKAAKEKLAKEAAEKLAKEVAEKGFKGGLKKGARFICRKVPVVLVGFFIWDWASGGFGHAVNEATWPVSEAWSE